MDNNGLRQAEREAFDSLPRERMPSRILEERTVRALKKRGIIRSRPLLSTARLPWLAAGIAAALALFVSGLAVGQAMGVRQTADALAGIYTRPTDLAAARVQSTGSAHREALAALVTATGAAEPQEVQQAREVALAAFWAAANEIVRLAPDDPVSLRILQEVERSVGGRGPGAAADTTNVVWF
ncbi:MAG: hypothetical protein JSV86_19950 [Gemmatimonadota bacterium]|nr:MAG: hypothetical protein JSV86_19950 [Gemmatimonadota bacterium]